MARQRLSITVRGKHKTWSFHFDGDPQYLQEWRDDGLEIDELYYSIPEWLPSPLMRAWCFITDLFYLRNPFWKERL